MIKKQSRERENGISHRRNRERRMKVNKRIRDLGVKREGRAK
jgi:hypothetical protein